MLDWDRVGDAAGVLETVFLSLLNKKFVDDSDHLARIRMVQRTTAVARISSRIELEDVVGRNQPSQGFFSNCWPVNWGMAIGVTAEIIPRWVTALRPSTMPMGNPVNA